MLFMMVGCYTLIQIDCRGIRFIPSTHSLLLLTQHQGLINPLLSAKSQGMVNTTNKSLVTLPWWKNTPVLSEEEKTLIRTKRTAINRWRGVLCVPAR